MQKEMHVGLAIHEFDVGVFESVFFVQNRELVEKVPSPHTYLLLGDAYMDIQEV